MALRSRINIVPADTWYIERAVWLIAGFVLIASNWHYWLGAKPRLAPEYAARPETAAGRPVTT